MCDPWDSHGDEKNVVSISIAFSFDFLIRNENIISFLRNIKQKVVQNNLAYRASYKPSKLGG